MVVTTSKMKLLFLLCGLLCFINRAGAIGRFYRGHLMGYDIPPPEDTIQTRDNESVSTNYIQQRLDHYDPSNTETWTQRYYANDEYFNTTKRDVAFLMISGEGQAAIRWVTYGAWVESAEQYEAMIFQLEHRFYGESHPFSNLSTENMRYLSSRQALGDLATFISAMNEQYNMSSNVKWIVFGGSYAGSLAAWLRQKYPHLVQGAMSASGPLYGQLDFPEYLQVVTDDLASYSDECVSVVKTAVNQLEELLTNPGDVNITSLFNLCESIDGYVNSTSDMANFFELIADDFAGIAQYNKNAGRTTSIDDLCDILTNETIGSEVYRLAEVNNLINGASCLDFTYESTLNTLQNITITASGNMRQWIYQTCTEYGWYQTTGGQEDPIFGNRFQIDFFTQLCIDVYGEVFNETFVTERIGHTNIHLGGYDIDVSNVVFVQGSFDPWYPMGLVETTNEASPVIFIDGTAHCANMYASTDDDLPALTEAREEVNRLIGVWLGVSSAHSQVPFSLLYIIFISLAGLKYIAL